MIKLATDYLKCEQSEATIKRIDFPELAKRFVNKFQAGHLVKRNKHSTCSNKFIEHDIFAAGMALAIILSFNDHTQQISFSYNFTKFL